MSLRQSFLMKRYSNFSTSTMVHTYMYMYMYLRIHAWYIWATVCQSQHRSNTLRNVLDLWLQHEVKTITVCQAVLMNSDEREARLQRRRECRAAESSEERET